MKLFRKICLLVFLGMFVLAAGLLLFSAEEVRRQGLAEARMRGKDQTDRNFWQMWQAIRSNDANQDDVSGKQIRDIVVSNIFQTHFGSGGVLWADGEELRNHSPYSFDRSLLEGMRQESGTQSTAIFVGGPFRAGERWLLVFYKSDSDFGYAGRYSFATFEDVTGIYRRAEKLLLYGAAFGAALFLLVGCFLYRRLSHFLKPLGALKDGAAKIADGEYQSRVPVQGKDEIGDVTESFNQMAEEVERHMEALRDVNEKQRQLLGSLAHEMRTPLTAIIGNADLLLTVRLKEGQGEQALTYILGEARRLARLSEKMLELTGLYENGGAGMVKKDTEIRMLFGRLKDSAAFRVKESGVFLEIKEPEANLIQAVDQDLMESLLLNLVDNACKASQPGGRILVSADGHGIYVEDFGRGIPEAELGRVTEAFYMVDKARGRSAGGSGLGLALCSRIAGLHGASLRIESREGEGTRASLLWEGGYNTVTKRG